MKLLDLEIRNKRKAISKSEQNFEASLESLHHSTSFFDYICLKHRVHNNVSKNIENVKNIHRGKLEKLGLPNKIHTPPTDIITNLSSRNLTDEEKYALSFGLEFCLPVHRPNFYSYFLSFEKLYSYLRNLPVWNPDSDDFNLKSSIQVIANKNYPKRYISGSTYCPLKKKHISLLRDLGKDPSITVSRPDKGRGVVVLDCADYINKVTHILSDHSKFVSINSDPYTLSLKLEDKCNRYFRTLKSKDKINLTTYNNLTISGSSPGIVYGLPKVHKPNTPIRPILSAYSTHCYKLAKYLVPLLSELTTNQYTVKNSFEFLECIKDIPNIHSKFICSFDVESLFTNVPLKETIYICCNQLFNNHELVNGFNRQEFDKLLQLSLFDTYFSFNNQLYKQIDGVAMGSPLGPTLANIFLGFHEQNWISLAPLHMKPTIYKRYVDDTFLVFDNKQQAEQFLQYLNSQHNNIRFTFAPEENSELPFLDVLVNKLHAQTETSVYRKATTTSLGTNFFSLPHLNIKLLQLKHYCTEDFPFALLISYYIMNLNT